MDQTRNRPRSVANRPRLEYARQNSLQAAEFRAMHRRKQHAAYIEEALRRSGAENARGEHWSLQPFSFKAEHRRTL